MMRQILLCAFVILLLIVPSMGIFGFGRKKNEEKEKKEGDVAAGLAALHASMNDPESLKETMALLEDPEAMAEVRRMMADPSFVKEMEQLKRDPKFVKAMGQAQEMVKDPGNVQRIQRDLTTGARQLDALEKEGRGQGKTDGRTDAEIGLAGLAAAARDPELLKDAMASLEDPETMAEVRKMMADPAFRAEMERLKSSPQFQAAMEGAAEQLKGRGGRRG